MSARLRAAMEATWVPAEVRDTPPWRLRRGEGGGNRVSAATALGPGAAEAIPAAEAAMRAWGQRPLFMLAPGEEALDAALVARGYLLHEPVVLMAGVAAELAAHDPAGFAAIRCESPLALMREIWAEGGIGPGRIAVMARSGTARAFLLGRIDDRPAGCAFVAREGDHAMLHALHVAPWARRRGVARWLAGAAAAWGRDVGARVLGLAVGEGNATARSLYAGMGMAVEGRYHYRIAPEEDRG